MCIFLGFWGGQASLLTLVGCFRFCLLRTALVLYWQGLSRYLLSSLLPVQNHRLSVSLGCYVIILQRSAHRWIGAQANPWARISGDPVAWIPSTSHQVPHPHPHAYPKGTAETRSGFFHIPNPPNKYIPGAIISVT